MGIEKNKKIIKYVVLFLTIIILCFYGYFTYIFNNEISNTISNLEARILELGDRQVFLYREFISEKQKNSEFETQIGEIVGTVSNLDKLAKTDKELLQKYSKVYFLNEHYVPSDLSDIPTEYLFNSSRKMQIHTKVLPFLTKLIEDSKKDGVDIKIISAYRSFNDQTILKNGYTVVYGTGSNRFSADQGYSEHQLGTTVDFTTTKTGQNFNLFKDTDAYKWLQSNAYKYGFILSYPEGNKFYEYEPWHWRFVGTNLARRLYEDGESFYDLNQSIIDVYLLSIFE